jgi:hypothetical protein
MIENMLADLKYAEVSEIRLGRCAYIDMAELARRKYPKVNPENYRFFVLRYKGVPLSEDLTLRPHQISYSQAKNEYLLEDSAGEEIVGCDIYYTARLKRTNELLCKLLMDKEAPEEYWARKITRKIDNTHRLDMEVGMEIISLNAEVLLTTR